MNKSILIKLVVVLLVAVLVHSVFWFFKTGQLEKHINNFVAENSSSVSVGEMKVVGYPLNQKIIVKDLKFTVPNPVFSKYQISIQSLEASSGIFQSDFIAKIMDKVTFQDSDGNVASVEFNQSPQISFSIADGIVSQFSYSDNGYKVFDIDKKIIYSATSSSININSSINDNDQITSKLIVRSKEMEGFDVLDVYRNSSEKKIIDGIKTGEISIGGGAVAAMASASDVAADLQEVGVSAVGVPAAGVAPVVDPAALSGAQIPPSVQVDVASSVAKVKSQIAAVAAKAPAPAATVAASAKVKAAPASPAVGAAKAPVAAVQAQVPVQVQAQAQAQAQVQAQAPAPVQAQAVPVAVQAQDSVAMAQDPVAASEAGVALNSDNAEAANPPVDLAAVITENNVIKSDLLINIEYVLTPTKNEQQQEVPLDPTQLQEVIVQYSRAVKVNRIEFSNSLYKISLNGEVNYFQDDNLPSGFITVQIENINNFTNYVKDGLNKIADQTQTMPDMQMADLSAPVQFQSATYPDFLRRVASGISPIALELAEKNQLSKEGVAVFDMRREKNLEFVINETPLREVSGKF